MADLLLADPVDAPEALLQSVGVPREVVVDHQVGPLQVHALPSGVVGQEHHHLRVVHERMNDLAALVSRHPAMDLHHRLWPPEPIADLDRQVGEGVLELGEQHQLAAAAIGFAHLLVIQDPIEFAPLGIAALIHHLLAQPLQALEGFDLERQLFKGLGCGGVIGECLLCGFHLDGGVLLVELSDVVVADGTWVVLGIESKLAARLAALQ